MTRFAWWLLMAFVVLLVPMRAQAVEVGSAAPDFKATDTYGKAHRLSECKGKFVVLEWHNRECPFTQKHYRSHNMQTLQKEWTEKGVVWFTVISSAPGQQGYMTADQENAYVKQENASPTAVLLDPTGELGHLYSAKTTPHMFVINPQGILIYDGAIDNKPTIDVEDIVRAKNYVSAAIQEALEGKQVAVATTRPYGCSVKYAR